jgi:hypothetical protein
MPVSWPIQDAGNRRDSVEFHLLLTKNTIKILSKEDVNHGNLATIT